jgi:hypothetical protein
MFSKEREGEKKICNGSGEPRCRDGKSVPHSFLHTAYAESFIFLLETAVKKYE